MKPQMRYADETWISWSANSPRNAFAQRGEESPTSIQLGLDAPEPRRLLRAVPPRDRERIRVVKLAAIEQRPSAAPDSSRAANARCVNQPIRFVLAHLQNHQRALKDQQPQYALDLARSHLAPRAQFGCECSEFPSVARAVVIDRRMNHRAIRHTPAKD